MSAGFAYTKDEMLQIYRNGLFKDLEFTKKFAHVPNATTPEILIPLALLPIESDEAELRYNPVVVGNLMGSGGRGRGGGHQEGGRGRGRGRDGRGGNEREGRGGRDAWGRQDARNSSGDCWDDPRERRERRGPRDSAGDEVRGSKDGGVDMFGKDGSTDGGGKDEDGGARMPHPPKEWFYRDLEMTVQGPFNEAQISEWFTAGYLPADLPMRASDEPRDVYTPLKDLVAKSGGEPPFVLAMRARGAYEAGRDKRRATKAHADAASEQQNQCEQEKPLSHATQAEEDARHLAAEDLERAHRQQAELEAQRQNIFEETRRRAENEAHRLAQKERQRILEETRRQAEDEARREREEIQLRLQAEANLMDRQQASELARRQAAFEDAQRRHSSHDELARHPQEEMARLPSKIAEHQRVYSMLPPASADNNAAGNALLSLLQGGGGGSVAAPPPASAAAGPPLEWGVRPDISAQLPLPLAAEGGELAGWGRGRGRGRGVCSAALGTGSVRSMRSEGDVNLLQALDAMGNWGDGLDGQPLEVDNAGKKERADKKCRDAGKRSGREADDAPPPLLDVGEPVGVPPREVAVAPLNVAMAPWGAGAGAAPSFSQIQVEEIERQQQREAVAAAVSLAAGAATTARSAWDNGPLSGVPTQAYPDDKSRMTSFADLMAQQEQFPPPRNAPPPTPSAAVDDAALLWEYGAAPGPPPREMAACVATPPALGAACAKDKKGKKTKGSVAPESTTGNESALVTALDAFGSDGGNAMPLSMATWCAQQMTDLTGNDDTTLTDFLYSLSVDDEVLSYLTMYLGASKAVNAFAKEFVLRKRSALGTGESREWRMAGRSGKPAPEGKCATEVDGDFTAARGKKGARGKKADPSLLGFSVESSRIMQGEIQYLEGI